MSDDGKRSELVCTKVTERMALDLLRLAVSEERSISDCMYRLLRSHLYGNVNRLDALSQSTK